MKEQFFYKDDIIFYRNSNMQDGLYYAAWSPSSKEFCWSGYSWDNTPTNYNIKYNKMKVSEKWLLLRGYECRPPHIKS